MKHKFDVRDVIDAYPLASAYYIFGKRKSGKSFSVKCHILDEFIANDTKFVYVGRLEKHIKQTLISGFFLDVLTLAEEDYKKQLNEKYNIQNANIICFRSSFWVVDYDPEKKKNIYIEELGITTAVRDAETFKRRTFNGDYKIVVFDEFISATGDYINNENELFQKIIDTVDRQNSGVVAFLMGNPDYDLEQNCYLQNFKWSYKDMPLNSVLTYDTKDQATGQLYKNNIVICKIASPIDDPEEYTKTSGVFSINETRSAVTGEVKHGEYNAVILKDWCPEMEFVPLVTIEQQTAVYTKSGRYRNIYATIGYSLNRIPTLLIHRHDRFKKSRHIFSSYFKEKYKPNTYLYKSNMELFPKIRKYFESALISGNVFVEDESTAQTYFNIYHEGQTDLY